MEIIKVFYIIKGTYYFYELKTKIKMIVVMPHHSP